MEIKIPLGSIQVVYGRPTKRVTLQRAIVSKILFFPEKVNYNDLIILYDNMLWLQEKLLRDPDFQKKFGITLKVLAYILKNLNLRVNKITDSQIRKLSQKIKNNLTHFCLEKRNVLQPYAQQRKHVAVRPTRSEGIPKKLLPPKAYIGKGYRDKGTAKKPWLDGSPSWQEVAMVPIKELPK